MVKYTITLYCEECGIPFRAPEPDGVGAVVTLRRDARMWGWICRRTRWFGPLIDTCFRCSMHGEVADPSSARVD